jgi:hypothetical protein
MTSEKGEKRREKRDRLMMTLRGLWRGLPRLRRECRVATGVVGLY